MIIRIYGIGSVIEQANEECNYNEDWIRMQSNFVRTFCVVDL